MRKLTPVLASAIVLALASSAACAQGTKKLYRWTDEKGEVHYTDQLPPEAAQAARDELNKAGMAVERIERAMTAEERAAHEAEQARLDAEKLAAEEKAKRDKVLLSSYPTEAHLARAYDERFELLKRTVESAQVSIHSQEKSLTDLLNHAADLERNGKPVPEGVLQSIGKTRSQVGEQREFLGKRESERVELRSEYDALLARYRELASASDAETPTSLNP